MTHKYSVVFLCLGNICRSTLSKGIFLNLLKERGVLSEWKVDSAGTANYHPGRDPDERTTSTLKLHGIHGYSHKARQLVKKDFYEFDYIIAMDRSNLEDAQAMAPHDAKAKVQLLRSFDKAASSDEVQDPYYCRDSSAHEGIFEECLEACKGFLNSIYR